MQQNDQWQPITGDSGSWHPLLDDWILATGFWRDTGFWLDSAFWYDYPPTSWAPIGQDENDWDNAAPQTGNWKDVLPNADEWSDI